MTKKRQSRNIQKLRWYLMAGFLAAFCQNSHAETPHQFVQRFAKFQFAFHKKIQRPDVFLASRSGDCDDFATLADAVLRRSGYTPRLFAVRMKEVTHVVCYIPETNAYIDYNNRAKSNPLVQTDGSLPDIADKVARSFGSTWHAAYEFSYQDKVKWLVNKIVLNKSSQAEPLLAKK